MSWTRRLGRTSRWVLILLLICASALTIYLLFPSQHVHSVSITEIAKAVNSGSVTRLLIQEGRITATTSDGKTLTTEKESGVGGLNLLKDLGAHQDRIIAIPAVIYRSPFNFSTYLFNTLGVLVLVILVVSFIAGMSVHFETQRKKAAASTVAEQDINVAVVQELPESVLPEAAENSENLAQYQVDAANPVVDDARTETTENGQQPHPASDGTQNQDPGTASANSEDPTGLTPRDKLILSFQQSGVSALNDKPNVKWTEIIGATEAKQALIEIAKYLRSPETFERFGARMRRGVLLEGLPGTGKTLLARAFATEADAAFFPISGTAFIELFVGVGAARIRDLFARARAAAPAIIFIDEIDAIGGKRWDTPHFNQEHHQALNQLLVELDGFESSTDVIVLAATNRADILDPALRRSGRFDRIIPVNPPSRQERLELIALYTKGKPLDESWTSEAHEDIVRDTAGMTGADIATVVNEAAISAASNNADAISVDDVLNAARNIAHAQEPGAAAADIASIASRFLNNP